MIWHRVHPSPRRLALTGGVVQHIFGPLVQALARQFGCEGGFTVNLRD